MGYETMSCDAEVKGLILDGKAADSASEGQEVVLVLDQTPFYTESGGQVSDQGVITTPGGTVRVTRMKKAPGGQILHIGYVEEGTMEMGAKVTASVDAERRKATMRSHTAAHLLQAALREVLGDHVHQAGQLVDEHMTRFDFTHFEAVTPAELHRIEEIINEKIMACIPVQNYECGIEEARAKGAMALFSEKYGDVVRVVEIPGFSMELCGGTHVKNTGELGLFKIVSESSVAAGVRRIEAVTGHNVMAMMDGLRAAMAHAAAALKLQGTDDLVKRCESMVAELKEKDREIAVLNSKLAANRTGELLQNAQRVNGVALLSALLIGTTPEMLRTMGDKLRDKEPSVCALLCGGTEEKQNFYCVAGPEAVKAGVHAGKIIKEVCAVTGGKGGGRPDSAMGGVGDTFKVDEALAMLDDLVKGMTDK